MNGLSHAGEYYIKACIHCIDMEKFDVIYIVLYIIFTMIFYINFI